MRAVAGLFHDALHAVGGTADDRCDRLTLPFRGGSLAVVAAPCGSHRVVGNRTKGPDDASNGVTLALGDAEDRM